MTSNTQYFKVIAKCGHVGRGNYVPVAFAVKATSRSTASQKVMTYHRVKKQLNDAIISCEEIDKITYNELKLANKTNAYLHSKCKRQQNEIIDFSFIICRNDRVKKKRKIEPVKSMKYKKALYELGGIRNNHCLCYDE